MLVVQQPSAPKHRLYIRKNEREMQELIDGNIGWSAG